MSLIVPYCGRAPIPGAESWNFDPFLLFGLAAWFMSYVATRNPNTRRCGVFAVGWLICAGALISPLCNISVALFSARVIQHMILALIGAPLVSYGYFGGGEGRLSNRAAGLYVLGFAFVLWFWHIPSSYAWTFTSDAAYWSMHLSTFAAAVLLWRLLSNRESPGAAIVASLATGGQMCALGAIVALSPRVLYPVHYLTTTAWGLSPLNDQQLGGLIMWVPAGLIITGHALWVLSTTMQEQPRVGVERLA